MQQAELNKITQLVKESSLLNPQEREEWLTLMGLMNDKQLLELEKILDSNRQAPIAKPAPLVPPLGSLIPAKTPIVPEKKVPAPNFAAPNLSHIVNLPKVGAVFPHPVAAIAKPAPKLAEKPASAKPLSAGNGFWSKVKDVLAEKELPPGHKEPTEELELIGPRPQKLPAPLPPKKPGAEPTKIFAQNVYISPLPPQNPAPHKDLILPSRGQVELSAKKVLEPKAQTPEQIDKLFVAGLKNTKVLMDAKLEAERKRLAPILPPVLAPKTPAGQLPKISTPSSQPVFSLTKVEDVEQLKGGTVNSQEASKLGDQLRDLVRMYGYHKVVFSLEKSPAYKSYINTGLAALSGKYDFGPNGSGGKYMSREEFESFVDVLRKMKG